MNPTWEEMVERDPLISFSWYLSGRMACLLDLGDEVLENLDAAFSDDSVDIEHFGREEMLMWFWVLGAYEVIRTMCQAKRCFRAELVQHLHLLKQELAKARMPAAKMEQPGKDLPVTSNRSPSSWDLPSRDLLIGDPTTQIISARGLLKRFKSVVSSVVPEDILGRHEDAYDGKT